MKSIRRCVLCASVFGTAVFAAAPAIAANIDIAKDPLVRQGEFAVQSVTVTDNTADPINTIKVECRFFHDHALLGSGMGFAENVAPHQAAQVKTVISDAKDADSTDCSAASVP
jgi:hypothetical protein